MSHAETADEAPIEFHEMDGWDIVDDSKNFLALTSTDGHSRIWVKEISLADGGVGYRTILYDFPTEEHRDGQFIGELMVRSRSEISEAVRELEWELRGWEHADVDVGDVPTHPGPIDRVGPPPEKIGGLDELIDRMRDARTVEDWSYILNDHIQWGNNTKVASSVGIFNLSSAHDCVNRGTERCQVGPGDCYAVQDEISYSWAWQYFRRQEYLWDCLDAETFADALLAIIDRKHQTPRAFKFNQAGDFRHDGDIIKAERIAERLADVGVPTFTYSASSHLDWSVVDHLVVNRSDPAVEYGTRRYRVVTNAAQIRDDEIHCPFDRAKHDGQPLEERPKCGECMACIEPDSPDVAVVQHGRGR